MASQFNLASPSDRARKPSCTSKNRVQTNQACIQAYLPKKAATGSTPFVTRLLRFSETPTEQKCVSRRGGHAQGASALARSGKREIDFENREFTALPDMRRRARPRNRLSTATFLWQCRGLMARPFVLERETSWPCCSAAKIYVTRLRRGHEHFLRCADGAVETRQPAVAQPAGCCVSNKYGATWGSRGELRCPLERASPHAHVLSDHVHRASCARVCRSSNQCPNRRQWHM